MNGTGWKSQATKAFTASGEGPGVAWQSFPCGRPAKPNLKGSTSREQANMSGLSLAVKIWAMQWCHLTWNLHMVMFSPARILRRNCKGLWEPSGKRHRSPVLLSPGTPWSTGRSMVCYGSGGTPLQSPEQVAHNPIQKERKNPSSGQYKNQPSRISEKNIPSSGLKHSYTINVLKLVSFLDFFTCMYSKSGILKLLIPPT